MIHHWSAYQPQAEHGVEFGVCGTGMGTLQPLPLHLHADLVHVECDSEPLGHRPGQQQ